MAALTANSADSAELARRRSRALPGLMLLALHVAVAWGLDSLLSSALLLAHFGLFLLWQPLWRGEGELTAGQAALVVSIAALLAATRNWWLIALWVAALTALTGGNVPGSASWRQRAAALLAALYLLSLLLMWVVPQLAHTRGIDPLQTGLVRYGLPLIAVAVLLVNDSTPPRNAMRPALTRMTVEPFYIIMLFLLVAALVLGSLVLLNMTRGAYALALVEALLIIAAALAMLSWLMRPSAGFAGFDQLWTRFLMGVGVPFESWVSQLAAIAETENDPLRFLQGAAEHVTALGWVTGVRWESAQGAGHRGRLTEHEARFDIDGLRLGIHTRWALSPAMLLHVKMLAQLVSHFHAAKTRELDQRRNAYTQAIHETGSRLTHDVKNLLQSLNTLCAAAADPSPGQNEALLALIQRQLPQVTQRLAATLDKLQSPGAIEARKIDAGTWWHSLAQRYAYRNVRMELANESAGHEVPAELFDNVVDNLIENALRKAPGAVVRFDPIARTLSVCDRGEPVPPSIAAALFTGPVPSQSSLGVGLYHAAVMARQQGYTLALEHNAPGDVLFTLRQQ